MWQLKTFEWSVIAGINFNWTNEWSNDQPRSIRSDWDSLMVQLIDDDWYEYEYSTGHRSCYSFCKTFFSVAFCISVQSMFVVQWIRRGTITSRFFCCIKRENRTCWIMYSFLLPSRVHPHGTASSLFSLLEFASHDRNASCESRIKGSVRSQFFLLPPMPVPWNRPSILWTNR